MSVLPTTEARLPRPQASQLWHTQSAVTYHPIQVGSMQATSPGGIAGPQAHSQVMLQGDGAPATGIRTSDPNQMARIRRDTRSTTS